MRLTFAAAIAASLIVAPSLLSTASADTMKNCSANWKAMSASDKAKTTYKDYSATCLKGGAATPAKAAAPANGRTGKDGWARSRQRHEGCRVHGWGRPSRRDRPVQGWFLHDGQDPFRRLLPPRRRRQVALMR